MQFTMFPIMCMQYTSRIRVGTTTGAFVFFRPAGAVAEAFVFQFAFEVRHGAEIDRHTLGVGQQHGAAVGPRQEHTGAGQLRRIAEAVADCRSG